MTLQEYQMTLFEDSEVWTLSAADFRARLSALLESGEDLKILEGLCSFTTRYGEAQGAGSYIVENQPQKVMQVANIIDTDSFGGNPQAGRVYDPKGLSPCLNTMQGGGRVPKIMQRGHGYNQGGEHDIAPTLTSNSYQHNNRVIVYDFYNKSKKDIVGTLTASGHQSNTRAGTFGIGVGSRIRKLTPRECWRLQGFPDWAFDKGQVVNSNRQLYKQAGNSVTVNVIEAIAKQLI